MSYIGREPQVGAYNMLDSLTASATADYSLTLDSTAFVPESANHLLVSLNGVIQKAGSSFTVSGSTLSFSSALTSSDSIDFVLALGNVLDIGTPSDATVTNAKTNFVSTSSAAGLQIKGDGTTDGTLQLNCSQNSHGIKLKSPAHSAGASYTLTFPTTDGNADEFLQTNGSGTLTWAAAGGGNTPQFFANKTDTTAISTTTNTKCTFNSELIDTDSAFASSTFTVPSGSAGKYFIFGSIQYETMSDQNFAVAFIYVNGSIVGKGVFTHSGTTAITSQVQGIFDLSASDTVELYCRHNHGSNRNLRGESAEKTTFFGGFKIG